MARVTRQADRLLGLLVAMVVARFLRETQLCAQLYHPNIVSLINACKTTSGRDMQPPGDEDDVAQCEVLGCSCGRAAPVALLVCRGGARQMLAIGGTGAA